MNRSVSYLLLGAILGALTTAYSAFVEGSGGDNGGHFCHLPIGVLREEFVLGAWRCAPNWPLIVGGWLARAVLASGILAVAGELIHVARWRQGVELKSVFSGHRSPLRRRLRTYLIIGAFLSVASTLGFYFFNDGLHGQISGSCRSVGGPGENLLDYGVWSCAPDWAGIVSGTVEDILVFSIVASIPREIMYLITWQPIWDSRSSYDTCRIRAARRVRVYVILGVSFGFFITASPYYFVGESQFDMLYECKNLGRPGEFLLSYDDWSCDPDWRHAAYGLVLSSLMFAVPIAVLSELFHVARWRPGEQPRQLFRRR
jgi:hypothetical protein